MIFTVVKDITECEKLWVKFSPRHTLWDLWGVAVSFYYTNRFEPYFIKITKEDKEIGLLPLWKDKEKNKFHFFAGTYLENKSFWFDVELFPKLLEYIPQNTILYDMNGESVKKIIDRFPEYSNYFIHEDFRYFLNLKNVDYNIENYLLRFNKKHRKNFLNDIKKINELNPQLIWESNENFDYLVKFNIERFGEESDFFNDPIFTNMVKTMMDYFHVNNMLKTLIIKFNGKIEGIEIAVYYDDIYYVINGGYNRNIPNLGKLIMFEHIKNAIKLKAKEIDFLVGDTGWKQLWNLEKDPYYNFKKIE